MKKYKIVDCPDLEVTVETFGLFESYACFYVNGKRTPSRDGFISNRQIKNE